MKTTQERAEELKWFQCIDLGNGYITKGVVDHCTEEIATNRYGIPLDLTGKTVFDVGCNDGYHSFLCERRGAIVTAIDPNQGDGDNEECFRLAKEVLDSEVFYAPINLEKYNCKYISFDICLYFGVLYHIENPLKELSLLFKCCKEYALIETAIAQTNYGDKSVWEFNHGFDNDTTNKWYPTIKGLENVLKYVGFKSVELIYNDGVRATVKAIK